MKINNINIQMTAREIFILITVTWMKPRWEVNKYKSIKIIDDMMHSLPIPRQTDIILHFICIVKPLDLIIIGRGRFFWDPLKSPSFHGIFWCNSFSKLIRNLAWLEVWKWFIKFQGNKMAKLQWKKFWRKKENLSMD